MFRVCPLEGGAEVEWGRGLWNWEVGTKTSVLSELSTRTWNLLSMRAGYGMKRRTANQVLRSSLREGCIGGVQSTLLKSGVVEGHTSWTGWALKEQSSLDEEINEIFWEEFEGVGKFADYRVVSRRYSKRGRSTGALNLGKLSCMRWRLQQASRPCQARQLEGEPCLIPDPSNFAHPARNWDEWSFPPSRSLWLPLTFQIKSLRYNPNIHLCLFQWVLAQVPMGKAREGAFISQLLLVHSGFFALPFFWSSGLPCGCPCMGYSSE